MLPSVRKNPSNFRWATISFHVAENYINSMQEIAYSGHTADIRMHIRADSLPELFMAGLSGMNGLLKKGFCGKEFSGNIREKIALESSDPTVLIIDFLSEILTLSHSHGAVFCGLEITGLNERGLEASVYGRAAGGFDEDIKAVTYHEAEVRRTDGGFWETGVVFDI